MALWKLGGWFRQTLHPPPDTSPIKPWFETENSHKLEEPLCGSKCIKVHQSPPDSYNPLFLAKSLFSPCGPFIWCYCLTGVCPAIFFFPGKGEDKMMLHTDIHTALAGPRDAQHAACARRCLSYPTQPLFPKPDLESILPPNSQGPSQGSAGGEWASEQRCAWAWTSDPTLIALWFLKTWARSQINLGLKEGFSSLGPVSRDRYGWPAWKSYRVSTIYSLMQNAYKEPIIPNVLTKYIHDMMNKHRRL